MEIRHYGDREDAADLVSAHGLAWRAAYEGILPADVLERMPVEADDDVVGEWHDRLDPESDRVLVAEVPPDTAGDAGDPAATRGTVVGYAYYRWGEGTEVLAGNDVGRAFYESRGFERTGTVETEIAGETYESAVYTLEL